MKNIDDSDEEEGPLCELPLSIHNKDNGSDINLDYFKTPDQGEDYDFKKSALKRVMPARPLVTQFNQMNIEAELHLEEILNQDIK